MFQVRVEADFAAAHFLKDYHGKCENLHGHNYKVYVHAQGEHLDEGGMLLDFSQLKKALRTVCKKLDHTNLNDFDVFKDNPSAERIAMYIYNEVCIELAEMQPERESSQYKSPLPNLDVAKDLIYCVDVFETDTSRARYIPSK